jgi:hypothetical protein
LSYSRLDPDLEWNADGKGRHTTATRDNQRLTSHRLQAICLQQSRTSQMFAAMLQGGSVARGWLIDSQSKLMPTGMMKWV